jgi:hypothetical protein
MTLLWQVSVSQASRRQFQSSRKILQSFQLSKSRISCSPLTVQWSIRTPSYVEKILTSSACIHLDDRATSSGHSLVFEKNPDLLCRHGSGKTACNRPYARATPSGRGLNKETREARYRKAIAQFTVQTLYASVRMPPREILISGNFCLLRL